MKNKSHTIALFPILIALNEFYDKGIALQPISEKSYDQMLAIGLMEEALKIKYSDEQIKSCISADVNELNSLLKEHGFDIRLDEFGSTDLGVVTIMDLVGRWLEQGVHVFLEYENEKYPAIKIKSGASIIDVNGKETLLIRTRDGLMVFIEKTNEEKSGMDLFRHILQQSNLLDLSEKPCDAIIPMVDIDEQPDISWLIGMKSTTGDFTINQALQQNKLKITVDGIHAESAVTMGIRKGVSVDERSQFIIDGPFNLWITYGDPENKYFPLFGAHIAPDTWKTSK